MREWRKHAHINTWTLPLESFDRCLKRFVHHDLQWLDVPQHTTFKLCLLVFKSLHSLTPQYLAELLCVVCTGCRRHGAPQSALCHSKITKFFMTNCGQQAFSYAGPHAWNSLPKHLRQSTSIDLFKRSLKTFYTGRYRVQCIRDICLMGYISLLTYLQTPNCRRRRNDKSIGQ